MSDDVMSVMTPYPDVAQLAQGYMQRADGERLWVPLSAPSDPGAAVRFVIHLADGTVGFAGAGRCVQVADQGEAVDPAIRYEALLDSLAFDERSQPVYDYIVAVRAAALEDAQYDAQQDDNGIESVQEAYATESAESLTEGAMPDPEVGAPDGGVQGADAFQAFVGASDPQNSPQADDQPDASFIDEGETGLGGDLDAASAAFEPDEDGYAASSASAWSPEAGGASGEQAPAGGGYAEATVMAATEAAAGFADEATPVEPHDAYAAQMASAAADAAPTPVEPHDAYAAQMASAAADAEPDAAPWSEWSDQGQAPAPPNPEAHEPQVVHEVQEVQEPQEVLQPLEAGGELAFDDATQVHPEAPAYADGASADQVPASSGYQAGEAELMVDPEAEAGWVEQPAAGPGYDAPQTPNQEAREAQEAQEAIDTGILTRPAIATHWRPEPPRGPAPAPSSGLFLYDTRGLPQPAALPRPQLPQEYIVTRAIRPRDFPNGSTAPEAFAAAVGAQEEGAPAQVEQPGEAPAGAPGEAAVESLASTTGEPGPITLEPEADAEVDYEGGADFESEEPTAKAAD